MFNGLLIIRFQSFESQSQSMVVLIGGGSRERSELVTSCLKDVNHVCLFGIMCLTICLHELQFNPPADPFCFGHGPINSMQVMQAVNILHAGFPPDSEWRFEDMCRLHTFLVFFPGPTRKLTNSIRLPLKKGSSAANERPTAPAAA